jgi:hypothetical protein
MLRDVVRATENRQVGFDVEKTRSGIRDVPRPSQPVRHVDWRRQDEVHETVGVDQPCRTLANDPREQDVLS